MSYEIIKSIRIVDNKVMLESASNNVTPRTFEVWEAKGLTKILTEQGETQLHLAIMKEYENGNFQKGQTRYHNALVKLHAMAEYREKYDWRKTNYPYDQCPVTKNRDSKEFEELLLSLLGTKRAQQPESETRPKHRHGSDVDNCQLSPNMFDKEKLNVFFFEEQIGTIEPNGDMWLATAQGMNKGLGALSKESGIVYLLKVRNSSLAQKQKQTIEHTQISMF